MIRLDGRGSFLIVKRKYCCSIFTDMATEQLFLVLSSRDLIIFFLISVLNLFNLLFVNKCVISNQDYEKNNIKHHDP